MLKYKKEIEGLDDCPRDDFKQKKQKAYRFVFSTPYDETSFLPVIIKKPRRGDNFKEKELCDAHALSMFKTENEALTFYNKLKKRFPNIRKTIGDSLAHGKIEDNHGLVGNNRKDGHFSFFVFEKIELNKIFTVINNKL